MRVYFAFKPNKFCHTCKHLDYYIEFEEGGSYKKYICDREAPWHIGLGKFNSEGKCTYYERHRNKKI